MIKDPHELYVAEIINDVKLYARLTHLEDECRPRHGYRGDTIKEKDYKDHSIVILKTIEKRLYKLLRENNANS